MTQIPPRGRRLVLALLLLSMLSTLILFILLVAVLV
jgi:hypothetical protein